MTNPVRVLFAGESWMTHSVHTKGFDSFDMSSYHEGGTEMIAALRAGGVQLTYQPSHIAMDSFPFSRKEIDAFDVVILSDIGANSLLLPDRVAIRSESWPNRLHLIRDFVNDGGGLLMVGGYLTFQGIQAKGNYKGTSVEDVLPIELVPYDDRLECPQGVRPTLVKPDHPVLKGLSDWPQFLGYNRSTARPDADVLARVGDDPFIAVRNVGRGRSAIFASDCGPHWGPPPFLAWKGYGPLWTNLVGWLGEKYRRLTHDQIPFDASGAPGRRLLKGGVQIMNLLKRASAQPTAAFSLPILLSAAILVAHGGSVQAADKMVGGEFATKGIVTSTVGPNDAKGQPASVLTFTDDEVKKLHDGHYSAALLFQTSSDWADAVTRGAEDEFKSLGVEIAGLSNSNFSASDQAHAVQTIMAKKPSGIVTWPINPDELSPALKKAAEAGIKLALISNMPSGFQQGKDYTGLVGDDLYAMGQKTADNLAKAMGGEGELGFLYFDANAYVVNQRDAAFRTTIEKNYPNIKIIPAGFSDPSRVFQVASAMILQHPKIKAIYAPWADPASGVLQAVRAAHRDDIAVGTMDLSNTVAVSLVTGGAVKALTVDDPYSIGKSLAAVIGYGLLGKDAPAYVEVPAIPITKDNILQAYADSYHASPPPEVTNALGK